MFHNGYCDAGGSERNLWPCAYTWGGGGGGGGGHAQRGSSDQVIGHQFFFPFKIQEEANHQYS